jgi:hypothetical protein
MIHRCRSPNSRRRVQETPRKEDQSVMTWTDAGAAGGTSTPEWRKTLGTNQLEWCVLSDCKARPQQMCRHFTAQERFECSTTCLQTLYQFQHQQYRCAAPTACVSLAASRMNTTFEHRDRRSLRVKVTMAKGTATVALLTGLGTALGCRVCT